MKTVLSLIVLQVSNLMSSRTIRQLADSAAISYITSYITKKDCFPILHCKTDRNDKVNVHVPNTNLSFRIYEVDEKSPRRYLATLDMTRSCQKSELLYDKNPFKLQDLFIYLFVFLFFFTVATQTLASEKIIAVDPLLTRIELQPSQEITSPITISNLSDQAIRFEIELLPFTASPLENGQPSYYSEPTAQNNRVFDFLETVKILAEGSEIDSITLAPHQQKRFEVKIQAGEKMTPSDYYFSFLFISKSSEEHVSSSNTYSKINNGVASHILLTIGPQKKAQAFIEEFSVPFLLADKKAEFRLRVKNSGTHMVKPHGSVYIRNMFGQTVGKIDLASVYVLSDTIRSIPDKSSYTSNQTQESSQRIHWNEAFLLGPYSATVVVQMEPNAYTFSQTVYFIGIPAQLLLIFLGSLLAIGFIILRVKKLVNF